MNFLCLLFIIGLGFFGMPRPDNAPWYLQRMDLEAAAQLNTGVRLAWEAV